MVDVPKAERTKLLTQILPGLRDVRAPLAAGYLWLVSVWFIIFDQVPAEESAEGVYAAAYQLADTISVVGAGVALSFLAYVAGALSLAVIRGLIDPLARAVVRWQLFVRASLDPEELDFEDRILAIRLAGKVSRRAIRDLVTFARDKLDDLAAKVSESFGDYEDFLVGYFRLKEISAPELPEGVLPNRAIDWTVRDVAQDLDLVATRLIDVKPELYSEYDRLRAEADFRYAIALPLAFLVGVLAVEATGWWLFAEIGVLLLFADGVRLSNGAGDVLAGALRAESVTSGVLERMAQRADDYIRAHQVATTPGRDYPRERSARRP